VHGNISRCAGAVQAKHGNLNFTLNSTGIQCSLYGRTKEHQINSLG